MVASPERGGGYTRDKLCDEMLQQKPRETGFGIYPEPRFSS